VTKRLGRPPSVEISPTILAQSSGDNRAAVAFGIGSYDSNAMKSANPHAGIYEASTTRTLDCNGGNPACNQGGMAVVAFAQNQRCEVRDLHDCAGALAAQPGANQQTYIATTNFSNNSVVAIEGNGARPSHLGKGYSENGVSFSLNTIKQHGVAYGIGNGQANQPITPEQAGTLNCMHDQQAVCIDCRNHRISNISGTLQAKSNGGQSLNYTNPVADPPRYIVRRLTPQECALLQGFPVEWCAGLETPDPSEEDIAFWAQVFETQRRIVGKSTKPKSRAQIIKWLQNPHSDAKEYAMWGNGVALPCVVFVLQGIVDSTQL
jgi:DNA (cytosine-5)-methyltransferase 1